ncbi:MAG: FAD-binding protein [Alphaproteobacteria bacterium]|nr:FAD-binding protein [Alphaproteobacteria bacterium]
MSLSVRFREPLSRHTAWRTGGPCDVWVVAHDDDAVVEVLADCKAAGWDVTVVGSGSHTLVRDGGIDGVVLRLGQGFCDLRFLDDDRVEAGGALPVPALLALAGAQGLAAPEALYGVPGTFGASVLRDPWDVVTIDLARERGVRTKAPEAVGARTKGVVLRAVVQLERVGVAAARARLHETFRKPTTPTGAWFEGGRGSIRKLLRKAALDRVRLRQVAIPDGAPEMLVNLGGGTASDLRLLQKSAIERVKRTRGVDLVSPLKWVGGR